MRSVNPFRTTLFAMALLLALAAPVAAQVDCELPSQLLEELYAALPPPHQPLDACDWDDHINASYNQWNGGFGIRSQNLPMIAAAVGLFHDRSLAGGMTKWWKNLLRAQTGLSTSISVPPGLTYLKGHEMFSNIYDFSVVTSVLAVYYWATVVQPSHPDSATLRSAARRYLRATFYIYGMATLPGPAQLAYFNDQVSALHSDNHAGYLGPFVALANPRSSQGRWDAINQNILLAQALDETPASEDFVCAWPCTFNGPQQDVVNWLEQHWIGSGNVFGLSAFDRATIRNMIEQNQLDGGRLTTILGLVRLKAEMRFLAWNGVRVNTIALDPNSLNPATFAAAFYRDGKTRIGTSEAHFLFPCPEHRLGGGGSSQTSLSGNFVRASHCGQTVEMGLRPSYISNSTPPAFHVTLGPNGLRILRQ